MCIAVLGHGQHPEHALSSIKAILAATLLASGPAVADDPVDAAHRSMDAAMREHAPMPSHVPALPDRTVPARRVQDQQHATRRDADRAAQSRATADAHRRAREMRSDAANRAAMGAMMKGTAGGVGGDDMLAPADMMKSRGMMPGGGQTPGMPPTGMPGGGMQH